MCLNKGKVQRFRGVGWAAGDGPIGDKIQTAMTRGTQTGSPEREGPCDVKGERLQVFNSMTDLFFSNLKYFLLKK